jgi:hypothetical protein
MFHKLEQQKSFHFLEKSSRMGYYKSTRLTQKRTLVRFCVTADARIESALRHFRGESKPFSHIFERQSLSLKNGKRVLRL